MAYAAGRSGARLSTHTTQALITGRYPFLSFTRAAGIQKLPDEIKRPGVAFIT